MRILPLAFSLVISQQESIGGFFKITFDEKKEVDFEDESDHEELLIGRPFILYFGKPIIDPRQQMIQRKRKTGIIIMKGHSRHNYSLIGRKNQAKFENDRVSRNGHFTLPNSMILVSFSFAEDALFNDVNKKL